MRITENLKDEAKGDIQTNLGDLSTGHHILNGLSVKISDKGPLKKALEIILGSSGNRSSEDEMDNEFLPTNLKV